MCGICGYVGLEQDFQYYEKTLADITKMTDSLTHRGPDGDGQWIDMDHLVALGHRRLSIIDLSEGGKQPMVSHSGRYVISFNGEIYNFPDMRRELEKQGVVFRSQCDTEVLLEYIDCYGMLEAMKQAVGMFGLAVYDRREKLLHLARDRFGEKSVYYGWNNGRFLFASELKGIKTLPFFRPEIDAASVHLFLRHQYIKSPWSIYRGIFKLLPGQIVTVNPAAGEQTEQFYYTLEEAARKGEARMTDASLDECVEELDGILSKVISRQLRADVPVGLFLSSGIDSAVTSAIAQKVCGGRLKTYSIGSYDEKLNEAPLAKEFAKILGTDHHEYYLNDRECMELVRRIPGMYDEPFSQPSAIPTYLVSRLARKDVTVAISGDGGDEMFAGYIRNIRFPLIYLYEKEVQHTLQGVYTDLYDYLQKEIYTTSGFTDSLVTTPLLPERSYRRFGSSVLLDWMNAALHFEAVTFMESETLIKVDRASMANSLEVREPFLDPEVADFAFRLPQRYKYDGGVTKLILKKLLARYLPETLFDIPKKGFWIPMHRYMRSEAFRELREWLFSDEMLGRSGLLNVSATKKLLRQQLDPEARLPIQTEMYNLLILQMWLHENRFI